MLDLKPYGAFIEHTIRPLFEESESLLKALSVFNLKKEDISKILNKIAICHIFTVIIDALKTIICTAIIGYAAWTISRS